MSRSLLNEYIDRGMSAADLETELQRLIRQYNERKRTYLFVYAVDVEKATSIASGALSLNMSDFYIIHEILRHVGSDSLDVYLETPGGSGEAAEEIVEFLHSKYDTVDFVIAGEAKSAGTLMALSADDIYMTESGSLGPIDAQVKIGRSVISAFDYVQWIEEKRREAEEAKHLNPVDATMIAQISPGEFESVFHAQQFAVDKVRAWLPKYKFKHWDTTETQGNQVTSEMKASRAEQIANRLIDHSEWRSHGRSLKVRDLEEIGLRIRRLEEEPDLCEIVYRIKTVIRLLFGSSTHYKAFVTAEEKLFRDGLSASGKPQGVANLETPVAEVKVTCPKCGKSLPLFAVFGTIPKKLEKDLKNRSTPFPKSNKLSCECGYQIDLTGLRNQLEKQVGKRIIDDSRISNDT